VLYDGGLMKFEKLLLLTEHDVTNIELMEEVMPQIANDLICIFERYHFDVPPELAMDSIMEKLRVSIKESDLFADFPLGLRKIFASRHFKKGGVIFNFAYFDSLTRLINGSY
jgi:hypothetical protein